MRGSTLALAGCLIVTTTPALATVVDVTFNSIDAEETQFDRFEVSGSLFFDTSETPVSVTTTASGTTAEYDNLLPFVYTLNGQTFSLPSSTIDLTSGSDGSSLQFSNYSVQPDGSLERPFLSSVYLTNSSEDLNVTHLPTSFAPSSGEGLLSFGGIGDPKPSVPISVAFSTVSPTPELPAWASMLVGLGLVGGLAWWSRTRGQARIAKPTFSCA
jgi:hypothetical protein